MCTCVHEGAGGISWQSWPGSSGLWGIVFSSVRGEQFADSNKLPPAFISKLTSSGESEPRDKDSLTRTHTQIHTRVRSAAVTLLRLPDVSIATQLD